MDAWVTAVVTVLGIAAEGIVLGFVADFLMRAWHPERPGDPRE